MRHFIQDVAANKAQTTITLQHVQEALGGLKVQQNQTNSHFDYVMHVNIARELTDYLLSKGEQGSPSRMKEALRTQQERAQVSSY